MPARNLALSLLPSGARNTKEKLHRPVISVSRKLTVAGEIKRFGYGISQIVERRGN
jgi:hypothetical protein